MQGKQLWEALGGHEIEGRNRQEKRPDTVVHMNEVFFTLFQNNYTVRSSSACLYLSTKINFLILRCILSVFICTKAFISHITL